MLRVSNLRKLVKPASIPLPDPCQGPAVALVGTEVGAPVSGGLTVEVLTGTVTATGAGYDFTAGVLRVTTAAQCPVNSEMTFSISGIGPVPALRVSIPGNTYELVGITKYGVNAAYKSKNSMYPYPYWALRYVPVPAPAGIPYELKCSIADTWVGVWLNGKRVARAAVTPGYLATTSPWNVMVGRFYDEVYTGHVDSVRLAYGALPDIDVL